MRSVFALLLVPFAVVAAPVPKPKPAPTYFPIAVGGKWEYAKEGEKEVHHVVEVTDSTEEDGERRVTFELAEGEKVDAYPLIYRVGEDGVRLGWADDRSFCPPRLDLRPTPKGEDAWECEHHWKGFAYEMSTAVGKEEKVEVPAGEFVALPHTQTFPQFPKVKPQTRWFAPGVGCVKFTTDAGDTFVLLKYTAGKGK